VKGVETVRSCGELHENKTQNAERRTQDWRMIELNWSTDSRAPIDVQSATVINVYNIVHVFSFFFPLLLSTLSHPLSVERVLKKQPHPTSVLFSFFVLSHIAPIFIGPRTCLCTVACYPILTSTEEVTEGHLSENFLTVREYKLSVIDWPLHFINLKGSRVYFNCTSNKLKMTSNSTCSDSETNPCSGHGLCVEGECKCFYLFTGICFYLLYSNSNSNWIR
jgi:hypothetical protein